MSFVTASDLKPRIAFQCDTSKIPDQDIKWLLGTLERNLRSGAVYRPGETLQIGWMTLKFMQSGDVLKLHEPDMRSMPIVFVDSATNTLLHLRAQKDTFESCDLRGKMDFPTLSQFAVAHQDYARLGDYVFARDAVQDDNSGWVLRPLGEQDANADEYAPLSLYQLACARPDLIKFLALPSATVVHVQSGDGIRILEGQKELRIRAGSYIEGVNRAARE